MKITRERFVAHFAIAIDLRCLRKWDRRSKTAPDFLGRSIYETIRTTNGTISVEERPFSEIVNAAIRELYERMPRGTRPERYEFGDFIYDRLDRAGIDVEIGPPLAPHGCSYGSKNKN